MDKQQLRALIREKKRAMNPAQIEKASRALTALFLRSPQYRSAKSIYGYLPFNQEVDTYALLSQAMADGKRVALPKAYGDEMRFIWVTDLHAVQKAALGCPEPAVDAPVAHDPEALILLPGLAFDLQGNRMGYGGGYYDRFLATELHPTVALCYSFQLLPEIAAEPHDVRADCIISTDDWR